VDKRQATDWLERAHESRRRSHGDGHALTDVVKEKLEASRERFSSGP